MVDYKRLDRVIEIGAEMKLPVVIAGAGPAEMELRAFAADRRADVTFIIGPSDPMIRALYAHALAYVFPAVEDFGIMPVEAMACGTPMIANSVGGVRESVEAVGGGVTCDIDRATTGTSCSTRRRRWMPQAFRERTRMFSRARFITEVQGWVGRVAAARAHGPRDWIGATRQGRTRSVSRRHPVSRSQAVRAASASGRLDALADAVAVTRIGRWSLRPCGSVRTRSIVKPTEVAKS